MHALERRKIDTGMLTVSATLLGGLGLFLLAVGMITDGLKLAAGDTLRDVLARSTSTPLRGVASGILVTALVQSSSAVTVATIGFVNAGLLTLPQSLGVVYGANIGTTMTGWLVASVGFGVKLETFALPLVGLGMLGRLVRPASRIGAAGEALAGFGLFFIGIDVLQGAFAGLAGAVDVAAFAPQGGLGLALYLLLGFFMTVVTQSSSAAIALTLTAATGGALALDAAAAMVIGANVGTTSTAALATIGATANARRVAAAHVAFNAVTGAVALALLAPMLWAVGWTGRELGLEAVPAVHLALFHTAFNVLGVAIMLPLAGRLSAALARRFVTREETLARPQFLDRTVLVAPSLALEALKRELLRATGMAQGIAAEALSRGPEGTSARDERHGLRGLLDAVEGFVTSLEGGRLTAEGAQALPTVLRVSNYLDDVVTLVEQIDRHRGDVTAVSRDTVLGAVVGFQAAIAGQLGRCDPAAADFDGAALDEGLAQLEADWHELKSTLLAAAGRRELPVNRLNGALEGLRSALRVAEQLTKAARRQAALGLPVEGRDAAAGDDPPAPVRNRETAAAPGDAG